jgi:hypothetical protein
MKQAHNRKDRTGEQYNSWTIEKFDHQIDKRVYYLCRCVCGRDSVRTVKTIVSGVSKSCGCMNIKNHTTHGMSNSRTYNIWQNMKNRCCNPKSTQYKWYGHRGISVCDRWKQSFISFLSDMGVCPSKAHSIDRINNDGNYEPGNCRWSTHKEQCNNRRTPSI